MDTITRRRRRLLLSVIVIALICFVVQACVVHVHAHEDRDYGSTKKEQRDLSGFTGVDAGGVFDIDIQKGSRYSVSIEAGERLLPLIETSVSNQTLKIKFDRSVHDVDDVRINITMPELDHIDVSGATTVRVRDGFVTERFDVDLSGATSTELDIAVNKLQVDLSGASELVLKGKAYSIDLDASGASEVYADDMVIKDAVIDLSGASEIRLNVTGELVAESSGASEITCISRPQSAKINSSGVSDISC